LSAVTTRAISAAKLATEPKVRRETVTQIRFGPCHVRPGDQAVPLPDLHLVVPPERAGSTIKPRWRITSTSADSWTEGDLVLDVASQITTLDVSAA
jgi:hypothetical protein